MSSYCENLDVYTNILKVCGISTIHMILMTLSCTKVVCVYLCVCMYVRKHLHVVSRSRVGRKRNLADLSTNPGFY